MIDDPRKDAAPAGAPTDRRGFFREAFAGMLGPVVEFIHDRLPDSIRVPDDVGDYVYTPPPLRPPGAVDPDVFGDKCIGCGDCAEACAVGAILLDPDPRIDPNRAGCRMCKDTPCIAACKSGALEPVGPDGLRLGLAVWDPSTCVVMQEVDCDVCRKACPRDAITPGGYYVEIDSAKCTGCGLCQTVCPIPEKGIAIEPY